MEKCPFCLPDESMKERMLKKKWDPYVYAIVPDQPATFGHVVIVSMKSTPHFEDITDLDPENEEHETHLEKIIFFAQTLSKKIKENLTYKGKKVKKVYLLSLCETPHLHFHLIPRFEADNTGYLFLFEKELEENRWQIEKENVGDTNLRGGKRIAEGEGVLSYYTKLLDSNKWAKDSEQKNTRIKEIKRELDRLDNS